MDDCTHVPPNTTNFVSDLLTEVRRIGRSLQFVLTRDRDQYGLAVKYLDTRGIPQRVWLLSGRERAELEQFRIALQAQEQDESSDPTGVPAMDAYLSTSWELTANERSILEWLLHDSRISDVETLRAQIPHARVVAEREQMPTYLNLAVSGTAPAKVKDGPLPGGATVVSTSGQTTGGLILWVASGYLDFIEHWWVTDDVPLEFPAVDRLRPFRPEEDLNGRTAE